MKTKLSPLCLVSCVVCLLALYPVPCALCQIPQGFNYQAIVRNSSGDVIQSQNVKVKVAIQKFDGTVLWDEEHALTTTQFGLVTFVVGTGPNLTGIIPDFSTIDWTAQTLYLKTYVQYPVPGSYTEMGTTQIWSVPYALRSKESEQWKTSGSNIYRPSGNVGIGVTNPLSKVVVQPDASWDDGTPLFEVKNKIGVPVLAVYNNGVRILVDHTYTKGLKGGFAVGGYDQTKAGKTVDFMTISPDSIRFNINNDNAKGLKGGFAVGGFDVTNKGGPINQDFMYITPQTSNNGQYNTFLGYQSGYSNQSTGLYNSFIGYNTGYSNTSGGYNVFVGYKAGSNSTNASGNTTIGYEAGQNTKYTSTHSAQGSANVFIGMQAGANVTTGCRSVLIGLMAGYYWKGNESDWSGDDNNVFVGYGAGAGTSIGVEGSNNTYIGTHSGGRMQAGSGNALFGDRAAVEMRSGNRNVMIGGRVNYNYDSGTRSDTTNDNVYIGYDVAGSNYYGRRNVIIGSYANAITKSGGFSGYGNVFIGYKAGYSEQGNNKLYISNSSTSAPLIGGDFSAARVGINRMPTNYTLEVGGTIWANGATITAGITTWSDARYKTDVAPLTDALNDILRMQGVMFNWRRSDFPDLNFPEGQQIGVIAQDVEKILPQLVYTGPDGYKSVSYEKLTPVLIEAIKEQQQQIESQKEANQQLKSELQTLREEVEQIKLLQSKEGSK